MIVETHSNKSTPPMIWLSGVIISYLPDTWYKQIVPALIYEI
jgi:hypothetical protein